MSEGSTSDVYTIATASRPNLPDSWSWTSIDESLHIIDYRGRTPPFSDTGIPHLRSSNVKNGKIIWERLAYLSEEDYLTYMTRGLPAEGDVLFTTEAPLGEVALAPETKFSLAQRLLILRPPHGIIVPGFLAYQLMAPFFQSVLRFRGTGTTVTGISSRNFKPLPLSIAPVNEQNRIVAKIEELFSDLDAGVVALKRAKANLKRYRAAVLKAAVEGKLTVEWRAKHPAKEHASTLLDRILKERRQKWEEDQLAKFAAAKKEPPKNWRDKYVEPTPPDTSGLPKLPNGWCWATIQQLAFVDVGFAFKSAEYTMDGIRLLRGENMEPGSLRWNDVRYWPEDKLAGLEHLLVKEGQIILAMDRPLVSAGLKLARVRAVDLPCLLVQRMARLRILDDAITGFLHCSMQTHAFISHLLGDQTGTQLPHISGSGIEEFVTPLPPLIELQQIAAEVAEKLSQIEAAEKGIANSLLRASRLRQSILKQAFEGKLVAQDPKDEPTSALLKRLQAKLMSETSSIGSTRRTVKRQTEKPS